MTDVVIIRHGETEWNRAARYQGQSDSPLTGRGIAQAKLVAGRLSGVHFDLLISSDPGRAVETARLIAEPHSDLRRECVPRLRLQPF